MEPTVANPYLEKFYADPKSYALKLQVWIYRQRFKLFVAAVSHILTTGEAVVPRPAARPPPRRPPAAPRLVSRQSARAPDRYRAPPLGVRYPILS